MGKRGRSSVRAGRNSVVEFSRSGQEKQNKAESAEETLEQAMKFTGTLIKGLIATVERAERKAQSGGALGIGTTSVEGSVGDSMLAEPMLAEPWLASVQENAEYDSKFAGVA